MKIEHVALYVNDLEAAKDFFVRYLDAVPNAGYHNPIGWALADVIGIGYYLVRHKKVTQ